MTTSISFDFDGTLTRPKAQQYAKELLERGFSLVVVTKRCRDEYDDYMKGIIESIGLYSNDVFFTEKESKVKMLRSIIDCFGIICHIEDNKDEIYELVKSNLGISIIDVKMDSWTFNIEECIAISKYLK